MLQADDDCGPSTMWRVIYWRDPKQLGVDVPSDVSSDGSLRAVARGSEARYLPGR